MLRNFCIFLKKIIIKQHYQVYFVTTEILVAFTLRAFFVDALSIIEMTLSIVHRYATHHRGLDEALSTINYFILKLLVRSILVLMYSSLLDI